ncbi:MAG: hypothetical protein WCT23_10340, partial [Candidatus Neomarinimicrobiota bacterium]
MAAVLAGIAVIWAVAKIILTRSSGEKTMPLSADSIEELSADKINLLLARLENEEPPDVVHGAMCYRVAGPPSVAEYTCPVCGEKTVYDDDHTGFIEFRLETARRLAESINTSTEFDVVLDESLYCSFCSEASSEDACLMLRVQSAQGKEVSSVASVTDLRMLDSFLKGQLYWLTETGDRMPLRNSA